MKKTNKSHLVHVESLPDDSIKINTYGPHQFDNLYYSPNNAKLYQQYRKRIREIDTGPNRTNRNIYVRTNKGKTLYVSYRKLNKIIDEITNQK